MDINRLLSEELTYELIIRNLPAQNTVADKRVFLKNAFMIEKSGYISSYRPVQLDNVVEIYGQKLIDLSNEIEQFDFENKDNEYEKIYSRLLEIHVKLKGILIINDLHEGLVAEMPTRCLFLVD